VEIVRDPENKLNRRIVLTITIKRNKLRKHLKVTPSTEYAGASHNLPTLLTCNRISFSTTLIPFPPICLGSLLISRALYRDAFDPSFESVETLVDRPNLQHTNSLPLKWKDDMLDQYIIELPRKRFYELWERTVLASGMRVEPRFYSMRVGAGGRLDGKETVKS
jgi:hypothetical protein